AVAARALAELGVPGRGGPRVLSDQRHSWRASVSAGVERVRQAGAAGNRPVQRLPIASGGKAAEVVLQARARGGTRALVCRGLAGQAVLLIVEEIRIGNAARAAARRRRATRVLAVDDTALAIFVECDTKEDV